MEHDVRRAHGQADAEAIARVLAGQTECFAELVDRYQAALYRYAVSVVLDHDVAADMVQDAFVRAFTSLGSCRDRTRFRSWLFQTLRNRCLDYLKEPRRRNVPLDHAAPIVDEAAGPIYVIERRQLRKEIHQALMELPVPQREAFLLHHVDGLSYEALAELLDASVSALKMRVMRAREALSTALNRRAVTERPQPRLQIRRS
ncbi:MAG: RNA polymerase sigma factor [Vicinamibacterales bacterium]